MSSPAPTTGAAVLLRPLRFLIAASMGVLVLGGLGATRPDRMLVEHVEFVGNDVATPAELRHLANLRNGTRMWEVDLESVSRGVSAHPWVRAATVRNVWPDTIEVQIEEFEPVAVLHHDGLYYVAADGTAFTRADPSDLDYPQITGITPELGMQHPQLPGLAVQGALGLIEALERHELLAATQVHEVHFRPTRGYTITTDVSEIRFAPGRTDEQVERLATLVSHGKVDLDRPTLVDLGPRSVAVIRDRSVHTEG